MQNGRYFSDRLANGLRVITVPMKSFRSVSIIVMARLGSRFEEREKNGLSHFMEHMFFKGASRYKDSMQVSSAIDSVGGIFNAFTSEEKVAYYIKVGSSKKEIGYDLLSDMIENSRFESEEIEKEKGVIAEEIKMYNDDPMSKVMLDFKRNFFQDQPLGWSIAGDEPTIYSFKRDHFIEYKERFYHPNNMVLAVAGDIDQDESLSLAEKYFSFKQSEFKKEARPSTFLDLPRERFYLSKKEIEQVHIVLGIPTVGLKNDDLPALSILDNILGGTMSSRLFYEIREKRALAYYVGSGNISYTDTGVLKVVAGINKEKVSDGILAILDELIKIRDGDIKESELEKAKDNIKGKLDLKLEDSLANGLLYATGEIVKGEIKTPEEIIKELDAVTIENITMQAKRYIDLQKMSMTLLAPFTDSEKIEKSLSDKIKVAN